MTEAGRWRTGDRVPLLVLLQVGEQPSEDDPALGTMNTPHLASQVVEGQAARRALETARTRIRERLERARQIQSMSLYNRGQDRGYIEACQDALRDLGDDLDAVGP